MYIDDIRAQRAGQNWQFNTATIVQGQRCDTFFLAKFFFHQASNLEV